jgi:hypothetical protein
MLPFEADFSVINAVVVGANIIHEEKWINTKCYLWNQKETEHLGLLCIDRGSDFREKVYMNWLYCVKIEFNKGFCDKDYEPSVTVIAESFLNE